MIFGFGKRRKKENNVLEFDRVPDGHYRVKIAGVKPLPPYVVMSFEVVEGDEAGHTTYKLFSGDQVKSIVDQYSGEYLSRIHFETEDKQLDRLYDILSTISDDEVIGCTMTVSVKDTQVKSFLKKPGLDKSGRKIEPNF